MGHLVKYYTFVPTGKPTIHFYCLHNDVNKNHYKQTNKNWAFNIILMHILNQWSHKGNSAPHGTFGNVWRPLWVSWREGGYYSFNEQRPGMLLNHSTIISHNKKLSGPKCRGGGWENLPSIDLTNSTVGNTVFSRIAISPMFPCNLNQAKSQVWM